MEKNVILNDDNIIIKINKEIYSKEIILQSTYVLLDKYYFIIDIENDYWLITIKNKKENSKLTKQDALNFFDELIESASYLDQLKRTSKIRETILEKAILAQTIDDDLLELENN